MFSWSFVRPLRLNIPCQPPCSAFHHVDRFPRTWGTPRKQGQSGPQPLYYQTSMCSIISPYSITTHTPAHTCTYTLSLFQWGKVGIPLFPTLNTSKSPSLFQPSPFPLGQWNPKWFLSPFQYFPALALG